VISTYAKVIGVILLLIGILGFIPGLTPNDLLFGMFLVSPMHNVIHMISGLIFVGVGFSENWELARKTTLAFAAIYGLITVLGFISPDSTVMGMPMNMADNVLHLVITVTALMFGLPQRYAMPR
jgi:hypothetical protein